MIKYIWMLSLTLFIVSCATVKYKGAQAKIYQNKENNSALPYNIFYPDIYYQKDAKIPLFVWLHGAGERGDDNVSQLIHIVPYLASDIVQSKFPSIIVAPQCPKEQYWAPVKRFEWTIENNGQVTPPMDNVMKLIEQLLKDPKIDKSRVYIGGLSMGGFGTLDLLGRKPQWFAAAVPICGGADLRQTSNYKNVPLWIFHGAKDMVVPVTLSRDLVQMLETYGATPRYTEYPEGGHDVWNQAIREPDLLTWLFSQSKN